VIAEMLALGACFAAGVFFALSMERRGPKRPA